jgi:hypothetical protein
LIRFCGSAAVARLARQEKRSIDVSHRGEQPEPQARSAPLAMSEIGGNERGASGFDP